MNMIEFQNINTGFGNMADDYDRLQHTNVPVRIMREKFYKTVLSAIQPPARMLEINCGSGIDAIYFAKQGFEILATDISDKMLVNASRKQHPENLSFRKMNFLEIGNFAGNSFDVVISNLGGLNCIVNPGEISSSLKKIITPGGYFVAALMPQFSLWEFLLLFKCEFKRSIRRLKYTGTVANVGGEKVFTKYFSPSKIFRYFEEDFKFIRTKALRVFAPPPPAANWYDKHPKLTPFLEKVDNFIEDVYFSSFIGDFYIIVLQKK